MDEWRASCTCVEFASKNSMAMHGKMWPDRRPCAARARAHTHHGQRAARRQLRNQIVLVDARAAVKIAAHVQKGRQRAGRDRLQPLHGHRRRVRVQPQQPRVPPQLPQTPVHGRHLVLRRKVK